ncbi:MAG: glycoside hydrolase family 95 protein [Lachnospiraceae bacterium]|nr:glycoside hydrolase family 95 protein [Lachnospiraceae bacterium]
MKFKGLKSHDYTDKWDEATPIGNGTIGGLVFGNPISETIMTNHEELFLPLPENTEARAYNGAQYLEETRKLMHEGKYREACEYYLKGLSEDGYPFNTIIWTNPFETASEIHIDMADRSFDDYVRSLDFTTGESKVSFRQRGEKVERNAFVSRSRNLLALEMRKEGEPFECNVYLAQNTKRFEWHGSLTVDGTNEYVKPVNFINDNDKIICESVHTEDESGYVSALRIITDGVSTPVDKGYRVSKANYLLLYYAIEPWKERMEAVRVKLARMLDDMTPDYTALLKEHTAIHSELFNEVTVSFSDSDEEYTNEELKELCTSSKLAPELLERMCDYGRYLEISSFGKLPPNLQGVWNGVVNPPWSSDYTLDENVQMMMWPVLPGGLGNFMLNYFDWLEGLIPDFKENAMNYYGCRGIFCCARSSSTGIHTHFDMDYPLVFWTAGAGWLSREYKQFYDYTGDENVLRRGIRYWKEIVLFYEDFMKLDETGRYEFAPSYSPENTPLGNDSPAAVNSTMDIAVAREVYTNLIEACRTLGVEEDNLPRWEEELSLLPEYTVNEDGALKEWLPAALKDDYHHRHSSHLYPVFPGTEALKEGNADLLKACHEAARLRLIDGVDAISGWGLAHLANISARLKDQELWYLALNRLIQVFTLKNLFTGHNPGRLFQMDANLGLTASVYEMFAYSDTDRIELFPVLSPEFTEASVKGLRAKGKVVVKELLRTGDSICAVIDNQGKNTVRIVAPAGFSFDNGDTEIKLYPKNCVTLNAGRI